MSLRNIAIIAHVDHGKTTLVDRMLHSGNLFRDNQEMGELIMDSGDLERERGITITAKNLSIMWKGTKINILDTPGHADFGGEVERVLRMADGVLLLVDAFEGPMPQTRFVTSKAIEMGLKPIVVINKVDKPNCRPDETVESVFDLLFALDATEDQLDFTTVYGSGKNGWMAEDWNKPTDSIDYLLDLIVKEVKPAPVVEGPLQMQITSLDYSSYTGRIAIGRIARGEVKSAMPVVSIKADGSKTQGRVKEVHTFEGLGRRQVDSASSGDIVALVGLEGFEIGDTVTDINTPEALPPIAVEQPTISMLFTVNNSPFYGKEGKYVTSRHLRDRLAKETEKNLALKVVDTESPERMLVYGRGILHLAVLIETMRREGYELQVGQPQVILKEIDGVKCEPIEHLVVDVPAESSGSVIEIVTQRKGELMVMEPKGDLQHLEFYIPSRGLIGLRTEAMTATGGEAIIAHRFHEYRPWRGEIKGRKNGVVISQGTGSAEAYAMAKLQDRGYFIIPEGVDIYGGQIVGIHSRSEDLVVNLQKSKQLTNVRASGSDDAISLAPPVIFSLEQNLEFIEWDEYLECTPESMRLRKIYLDENERKRHKKPSQAE